MPPPSPSFVRVALVLPTEFEYARGVLRGIIDATRERNLYAQSGAGGAPRARPWLFRVYRGIYGHSSKYLGRWFADWNPDGIICQIYDDRLARVYRDTRRPVVELFESRARSEFPRVLPDDVATGRLAAQHFVERGFRHFAFFGVPWMLWSRERGQGFRDGIADAFAERAAGGRAADASFTFAGYGEATDDARAFRQSQRRRSALVGAWLRSLPRPLALFAANDLWGGEVVQAAREAGLALPEDVAVLGVDNEELLCELAHPPLSSIRLPTEQIGHAAVAMLDDLLARDAASRRPPRKRGAALRIAPVDVVTRQSTEVLAVEDADVAAALQYIRAHAASGIGVKQLLEAVPVNRRTLERRFVSLLGHTMLEEIHRVRLARVKLLLMTDLPIYDVAERCGYCTPEHLATSFLKSTGQTPTAFRRARAPHHRWLPPRADVPRP